MQTFAKLDGNNIINIESLDDLYCTNADGVIDEATAANHFNKTNVDPANYKMATAARVNLPTITSIYDSVNDKVITIGGTYDSVNDKFIDPKPYSAWILNETTWRWDPPNGYPADRKQNGGSKNYIWNESSSSFDEYIDIPL